MDAFARVPARFRLAFHYPPARDNPDERSSHAKEEIQHDALHFRLHRHSRPDMRLLRLRSISRYQKRRDQGQGVPDGAAMPLGEFQKDLYVGESVPLNACEAFAAALY
jgi:hypothetical protein